jgi:hypothetical protein
MGLSGLQRLGDLFVDHGSHLLSPVPEHVPILTGRADLMGQRFLVCGHRDAAGRRVDDDMHGVAHIRRGRRLLLRLHRLRHSGRSPFVDR